MAERMMPTMNPKVEQNEPVAKNEKRIETPVVEEARPVFGVVTNCKKLNVRTKPNRIARNTNVILEVAAGTELLIDLDKSVGDWYRVQHASGVEGYCMKTYITLKK